MTIPQPQPGDPVIYSGRHATFLGHDELSYDRYIRFVDSGCIRQVPRCHVITKWLSDAEIAEGVTSAMPEKMAEECQRAIRRAFEARDERDKSIHEEVAAGE